VWIAKTIKKRKRLDEVLKRVLRKLRFQMQTAIRLSFLKCKSKVGTNLGFLVLYVVFLFTKRRFKGVVVVNSFLQSSVSRQPRLLFFPFTFGYVGFQRFDIGLKIGHTREKKKKDK